MQKYIGYIRSGRGTERIGSSTTVKDQADRIEKYADDNKGRLINLFADHEQPDSISEDTLKRVISMAQTENAILVVYHKQRLALGTEKLQEIEEKLKAANVSLVAIF